MGFQYLRIIHINIPNVFQEIVNKIMIIRGPQGAINNFILHPLSEYGPLIKLTKINFNPSTDK